MYYNVTSFVQYLCALPSFSKSLETNTSKYQLAHTLKLDVKCN